MDVANRATVDYNGIFDEKVAEKKKNDTYRVFNRISRIASDFPKAEVYSVDREINCVGIGKKVDVWCSNDYLGMSCHPKVINAAAATLTKYGVGSGGTRNISGNSLFHEKLERSLANWFQKEAGLVFTSCYVANSTTLLTLGKILPNCVMLSDEGNHASLIEGIRISHCEKYIFKHNDIEDLERQLSKISANRPKIVIFESINSMNGSMAPIKEICHIAHKYQAIVFLDEVHAVGLYGLQGSCLSEHQNCTHSVDIISGTLGKAVGTIGGFIIGKSNLIDAIRSYAPGLIFTTSLPPSIMSASIESIRILQTDEGDILRQRHQFVSKVVRKRLAQSGLPLIPSLSHIIPLLVGDSNLCKSMSKHLMELHDIYVQPINYPTVKFGTERLRIAPSPGHNSESIEHLVVSLSETWKRAGLSLIHPECTQVSCNCTHTCNSYDKKKQNTLQHLL
ncbi:hypothetical protein MXB_5384 [Myxobolus squamalis]|nr:hypothetical protein MXB_5384 [Myxobolus squamalis]